jgi:ABC-2 type transport system ATP-binding protein
MHRPSVLFLDEPTAGLDPQSRIALWEILRELHMDGQTILLTTHYMEEADQLCDRVAIIDRGRIVALDKPAGLKKSVGGDATVRLVADGDLGALADLLKVELGGSASVRVVGHGILVGVSGKEGVVPAVVHIAEGHGHQVSDVSVSETSLETVFLTLTGKDLRE